MERFSSHLECLRPTPPNIEDYFRKRTLRIVAKDGTAVLNGRLYEAPIALIGKKVVLLYRDHDPARVEIFFEEHSYGFLTLLDQRVNFRVRREHHRIEIQSELEEIHGASSPSRRRSSDERSLPKLLGFTREPFSSELKVDQILQTKAVLSVADSAAYTIRLGAMAMVTGAVGSARSTALRFATGQLHPSEHRLLWITAGGGSILELYRQMAWELETETSAFSRAALTRRIRQSILELVQGKKQNPSSSSMRLLFCALKSLPSSTP